MPADSTLHEWWEARKAILEYKFKPVADDEQLAVWNRLANAENALMTFANNKFSTPPRKSDA